MQGAHLFVVVIAVFVSACSTLKGEMRQAETAYDQANYEDAIHWFEALEADEPGMKADDRARYHYLRGMASYRLDRRDDALYYLSLAREIVAHEGAELDADQRSEMEAVLTELTPTDAGYRAREEGALSGEQGPRDTQEGQDPESQADAQGAPSGEEVGSGEGDADAPSGSAPGGDGSAASADAAEEAAP